MALKSNESPGVTIKEFDLSGTVPSVTSTTGAFVGDFAWGPFNTPVFVANESELVAKFGSPKDGGSSSDFLAVSQFLKYSGSAFVVRVGQGTKASASPFESKHAGSSGDELTVVVSPNSTDGFTGIDIEVWYDATVQVDSDGTPSVTSGDLLESFPFLSVTAGSTNSGEGQSGDTNFWKEVISRRSQWVAVEESASDTATVVDLVGSYELGGSGDVSTVDDEGASLYDITASTAFGDVDQIQIDFVCSHNISVETALDIAQGRKDCIAVASPDAQPASATDVTTWADALSSSSYLVLDGNWVQVYNKYQDKYEMIPACSSTAGIMAASDLESAPWFSPAGTRRGQYFGVSALSFNPTKSDRNQMYESRVNPIVSMPGQGTVLFGDKTALSRPSAFDRINVRRLFLVIERAIGEAAKNVMFELNDDFTRAEFTNIVEPFLREIQGRRGITDFRVVCDDTNNTPEVIDRNEFVASCFIKPARSINYVTLNFVAVRTGVEFEEVVGQI